MNFNVRALNEGNELPRLNCAHGEGLASTPAISVLTSSRVGEAPSNPPKSSSQSSFNGSSSVAATCEGHQIKTIIENNPSPSHCFFFFEGGHMGMLTS